jgi:hypothetical protein
MLRLGSQLQMENPRLRGSGISSMPPMPLSKKVFGLIVYRMQIININDRSKQVLWVRFSLDIVPRS